MDNIFALNKYNIYIPTYKLYHYKGSHYRIVFFPKREKGWEEKEDIYKYKDKEFLKNESFRTAMSRSRRAVREYIASNNFKYFVTLTVNSKNADRYSLQECQNLLQRLIHNYSRQLKYINKENLQYVIVTERHEDGAFHFHGVFSDLLQKDMFINDNGYLDSHYFHDNLGNFSCSEIKNSLACALYVSKYITQDSVLNNSNRYYFCSKGLYRPVVHEVKQYDLRIQKVPKTLFNSFQSTEFCKVRDFDYNDLDDECKYFLFYNFSNKPIEF